MNTLPRTITARYLAGAGNYLAIRSHWRALLASPRRHALHSSHHLLYAALIGRDWRRGFTPLSNPRKLANGAFYGWGLWRALGAIHGTHHEAELLAPFDGLVTPAMLVELRTLLPRLSPYQLDPATIADTGLPVDAYVAPQEPAHG